MATGDEVLLSEIENVDSQAGLFGEDLEKSMFRVRFIFVHSGDLMVGLFQGCGPFFSCQVDHDIMEYLGVRCGYWCQC